MKRSEGSSAISARSTVNPPMPESNTPMGRVSAMLSSREVGEIKLEEMAIDGGELGEIGDRDILVDLVDRGRQQPEFDHGAQILDETRVRGAAIGGKGGHRPRHVAHRLAKQRVERPTRGHKDF